MTLQFDLDRDIDGAARDVQAAINASRNTLPSGLSSNPTYPLPPQYPSDRAFFTVTFFYNETPR